MDKLNTCDDQPVIQARVISEVQLASFAPIAAINRQIITVAAALFDVEVAIASHQTNNREECLREIPQVDRYGLTIENEGVTAVV